jgi:hypothetical protein
MAIGCFGTATMLYEPHDHLFGSRDSAVGTATGYGLNGLRVGVPVLVMAGFSPFHIVQIGSGAHPDFYPMGTGGSFPPG